MRTENEKRSQRALAKLRREFIIQRIDAVGEVRDEEIDAYSKHHGFNWGMSSQSLKDDAAYFHDAGLRIVRPVRGMKFLRFEEGQGLYELRKNYLTNEKASIGQLAADLLRGTNTSGGGVIYTQSTIFEMLRRNEKIKNRGNVARSLALKLKLFYGKYDRLCGLDSGTTTLAVANTLADCGHQMLPDLTSPLKSLSVATNSTEIAQKLSRVSNSVDVVCIGGKLRKETQAFAGALTKTCLDAWNLHLDISFVGTIGIQVKRRFAGSKDEHEFLAFMSDTYDEASTKQALFDRSNLRVVLMDTTKLLLGGRAPITVGHYVFAALAGIDVDLLITDSGANVKGTANKQLLKDRVEECWRKGVAVLAADEEEHR